MIKPATPRITKVKKHILPVIVLAQFLGTSLWFATNAVLSDIQTAFSLGEGSLGHLTAAVQLGFILGTLVFAVFTIADRFSPSKVFFSCALLGAVFNLGVVLGEHSLWSLIALRTLTGFFLAGIYPVGMKLAADHFEKGLGKSLGYLVGALVLGTALPHLLNYVTVLGDIPWKGVIIGTTVLAMIGGILILLTVPDGPYRQPGKGFQPEGIIRVFKNREFKVAAMGYFGHMWELYAFWAYTPVILIYLFRQDQDLTSLLAFMVIGIGGPACVLGGYRSLNNGVKPTATLALLFSGICCLLSPLIFSFATPWVSLGFLVVWGMVVIADSPLFSTLVAQNAIPEFKGSALTIVNCIGFSITILSIQLLNYLQQYLQVQFLFLPLALGPLFGLYLLWTKAK
ncbi:MFS transporter [Robertkochia marina]|uniref:MFS transporter n=1 Tax=Robertkochia marina TaxID=1227945 RepID=A0A4S3M0Z5_9FLAO|nr:MFS transporter [Robertkochia marina]THD67683.1 MFS transporter [Robertkochia marina]TRZ43414.1 MFS transporter [Robertkochia marina]